MECKKDNNKKGCPCTASGCSRKGACCDCLKYHLKMGELPACCFSKEAEATHDRSFQKFFEDTGCMDHPK